MTGISSKDNKGSIGFPRVPRAHETIDTAEAKSAVEVGFKEAFEAIPPIPCQACTAACFTEYNYLYNLDPVCIAEWIKTTRG